MDNNLTNITNENLNTFNSGKFCEKKFIGDLYVCESTKHILEERIDEINYQLFDLMTSITLPKSITLINIPGMPTGDELNLNVIVQEDSYAQEWAEEQEFEISYYSE